MINTSDLMQKIGIHVGKFSEEVGWWRGDCSTLDSRSSRLIEVWPFVPVAKDLKDLLKLVGGSTLSTLNCSPIGQWLAVDQKGGVM